MKNYKLLLGLLLFAFLYSFSSFSQNEKKELIQFKTNYHNDSLFVEFYHDISCNTTLKITDDYNREIRKFDVSPMTNKLNIFCGRMHAGEYLIHWCDQEGELARHSLTISH